jgi:hypothetical protein
MTALARLPLINQHIITHGGAEVQLDGGERSVSRPSPFTPFFSYGECPNLTATQNRKTIYKFTVEARCSVFG